MARTIKEISDEIKSQFVSNSTLNTLYGWGIIIGNPIDFYNSKFKETSIESNIIWVVATCMATVENLFDWHKSELTKIVENERYGHLGWYAKMALLFKYGANISNTYNENDPDFAEGTIYDETAEGENIVKYAVATENNDKAGVVLKIAGENNGNFEAITASQLLSFTAYINRIKPAGIPINIINQNGDRLTLIILIYYDPLVLMGDGTSIINGNKPVEDAIINYLKSIDFNGEFIKMKLVDEIQKAEGVSIVENTTATAAIGTNQAINIQVKYTPYSGYMTLDLNNDLQITYLIND